MLRTERTGWERGIIGAKGIGYKWYVNFEPIVADVVESNSTTIYEIEKEKKLGSTQKSMKKFGKKGTYKFVDDRHSPGLD